ncbi:type-F conjugative transfer system mating-pair stabilization protein TraN [Klebsiella sp. BIGb0407]|uniref:type-F conjugative transfer system mating-pair stabilization protein TraN n=1 Tax=Klebsiella sp. BIGb0407 TaxID=2940603 RepID=UPI0021673F22|nr:type-F conjugative transfer system mating-pair stabilization protein TraN [Klebsiella sp. BIGb0407]
MLLIAFLITHSKDTRAETANNYQESADYARQIQGSGMNTLKNFKGDDIIPNYNPNPDATQYYGGVTSSGDSSFKTDASTEWNKNDVASSITESFSNRPADIISPDAPFIQAGKDVESRADEITGDTGAQCSAQVVNRSEFKNHTCERDVQVESFCTREATLKDNARVEKIKKTVKKTVTLVYNRDKRQWVASFNIAEDGHIVRVAVDSDTIVIDPTYQCAREPDTSCKNAVAQTIKVFDKTFPVTVVTYPSIYDKCIGGKNEHCTTVHQSGKGKIHEQADVDIDVTRGQTITVSKAINYAFGSIESQSAVTVSYEIEEEVIANNPEVVWVENCPFNKEEGTKIASECTSPGGTKSIIVDGKAFSFTEPCWGYKDTWILQPADSGSCSSLMNDKSCTLSSRQCAFFDEDSAACLHEYATFSCETRTSGKQMICGGEVFCLDGECEMTETHSNNGFGHAVSELAALAAAGKDVAEIDNVDVRAFTGVPRYCKKFAVGFSNCCADSGWGNNMGLASCSSDEKALGKAKEKKLIISIGEFCSKKVLGVCLEKKRSYCQFDSKLAQIVQQQGRDGQLHIGFGGAKSPDCRGISVDELQAIDFDRLDFTPFMEDLMNNQNLPGNEELADKAAQRIKALLIQSAK